MKKLVILLGMAFMLASCGSEKKMTGLKKEEWKVNDRTVYAYMPDDIGKEEKLPMVLDMNCTGGNPEGEVHANGCDEECVKERFIVIAPEYNDYATYSEVDYIMHVVDEALSRYDIDEERIYSTGFSNGGALSVALSSEHPERFAAISAAGWMIGMRNTEHGYLMPFQLLQGTEEFTENHDGTMEIMDDEKEALHDLFQINDMQMSEPDYKKNPYWGYSSDHTEVIYPSYTDYDLQGNHPVKKEKVRWIISDYDKEGYDSPFAQLVLIDGASHVPHSIHAEIAWKFFSYFKRTADGRIVELQ